MTRPRTSGGQAPLDVEILVRVNRDRREVYKTACAARGTTMADVARGALEGMLGPVPCPACDGAGHYPCPACPAP